MNKEFLDLFSAEMKYLREASDEFTKAFPQTAQGLTLDGPHDPYVERLLEGFAFLTARIQLKFNSEFPLLTEALLETVYPDFLNPLPAMSIVRFHPDFRNEVLEGGKLIARGSVLKEDTGKDQRTPCRFSTAHEVELWPLTITEASYLSARELPRLGLEKVAAGAAGLRLTLSAVGGVPLNQAVPERLTFHLTGKDSVPWTIYQEILARTSKIIVRECLTASAATRRRPEAVLEDSSGRPCLRPVGFEDQEALLPPDARTFHGYRILREYFALPQRFLFFEVSGLRESVAACEGNAFEIIFILKEEERRLEGTVRADHVALFCTPVVNLFSKSLHPVRLENHESDIRLIVEQGKNLDYEIYKVQSVVGRGKLSSDRTEFRPFYLHREADRKVASAFYTARRTPRPLDARGHEYGRRREYPGSDLHLSLVDSSAAPYSPTLTGLDVRALCTNAHLPMLGPAQQATYTLKDFPGAAVEWVAPMTNPRPAPRDGEFKWRLVSHLFSNYYTLLERHEGGGASALQQMLRLYIPPDSEQMLQQTNAICSVTSEPTRLPVLDEHQMMSFARGLRISLTLDEQLFSAEGGAFVFASVLSHFFANYVTLNSFTETVLISKLRRKEIYRWTPHLGNRPLI